MTNAIALIGSISYVALLVTGLLNARKSRDIKFYLAAFGCQLIVLAARIVRDDVIGIGLSAFCLIVVGFTIYLTGKVVDRLEGIGR